MIALNAGISYFSLEKGWWSRYYRQVNFVDLKTVPTWWTTRKNYFIIPVLNRIWIDSVFKLSATNLKYQHQPGLKIKLKNLISAYKLKFIKVLNIILPEAKNAFRPGNRTFVLANSAQVHSHCASRSSLPSLPTSSTEGK